MTMGVHITTCGNAMALENPRSAIMKTPLIAIAPIASNAIQTPLGSAQNHADARLTGTSQAKTQICTQSGSARKDCQILLIT